MPKYNFGVMSSLSKNLQYSKKLREITICGFIFSDSAWESFGEYLASAQLLSKLTISKCSFTPHGFSIGLTKPMGLNESLTTLDLTDNQLGQCFGP